MTLLLLPHQLFNINLLKGNKNIVLYEHPHYFTRFNFNKKKLILHRASMKAYEKYLKNKGYLVIYVEYNQKLPSMKYIFFDPIDKIPLKGSMIESPNFIMTKEDYKEYRKKTTKFLFTNFYMWSKKRLDIYPTLKSTDKLNRELYNESVPIPELPSSNKSDKKFITEAIAYVERNFSSNHGNSDNFQYPISHSSAKKWLKDFLKKRLDNFGPYQDFVKKGEVFMFHSILSSSLNISLLNPDDIIKELKKYKSKVKINSFEGYLRQLFWREYQRYCYIYVDFDRNY